MSHCLERGPCPPSLYYIGAPPAGPELFIGKFHSLETIMPTLASRAKGAIWGVCIADALGGPVQFKKPGTFTPIAGLCHVSPFDEPAG